MSEHRGTPNQTRESFVRRHVIAGTVASRAETRHNVIWMAAVFLLAASYLALRIPDADFLLLSPDQGYQMALGMAVAKGRLPGFDFITQYGPAVAFASYLGFAATGNTVGEMLLCTAGYAGAVAIGAVIVRRSAGGVPGLLAAVAMLLWFPRFYKWYYALFPLIGIVCAQSYYQRWVRDERSVLLLVVWSQLVGLAWLFRYDLGLEGGVFGVIALLVAHWRSSRSRWCDANKNLILFAFGTLMLPLLYMAAILAARGSHQLMLFTRSIYDGAADTVDFYSIPPFQFRFGSPLSAENALALWQISIPVIGVSGGIASIKVLFAGTGADRSKGYSLFCCSLVTLGVYPQSLHRADLQHLLQVVYPFIITGALLCSFYFINIRALTWRFRVGGGTAIVAAIAIMLRLVPGAASDLGSMSRDPVQQWRLLANLPASRTGNAIADMAEALQRLTPSDAKIFLVMTPTEMPLLFFAQRIQAGIFPVYEKGMFSGPVWLQQNRMSLESSPPSYLVTLQTPNDDPAPFMADLVREWRAQFNVTLYENSQYKLLAKGAPSR